MSRLSNSFIVVMPVYNGEHSIAAALDSVIGQDFGDLGIIIKDDISTDGTPAALSDFFDKPLTGHDRFRYKGRDILFIRNREKMYGGGNTYDSVINHVANPDAIIGVVDGDDALLCPDAIEEVRKVYEREDKWLVWSQHLLTSDPEKRLTGCSVPLPADATIYATREYWSVSHFRTCRAWLYHQLRREDLLDPFVRGSYFKIAGDAALLFPIIELCGNERSFFLDKALYLYNDGLGTNEHTLYSDEIEAYKSYIRNTSRRYARIGRRPPAG